MKIVALLSWWDESPSWLGQVIHSVAPLVDHVVAVDGAYATFPYGFRNGGSSGEEQHQAIVTAAQLAGVGLTMYVPPGPWAGGEVEKRSMMFRLGETITDATDWYQIIDADEIIMEMRTDDVRARLAAATEYAAAPAVIEMRWGDTGDWDHHHGRQGINVMPYRKLFRALRGLRVDGAHHFYRADVDGETVWLWGAPQARLGDTCDLTDIMLMEHRNHLRPGRRAGLAHEYYARRERDEIETHPPAAMAERWEVVPADGPAPDPAVLEAMHRA